MAKGRRGGCLPAIATSGLPHCLVFMRRLQGVKSNTGLLSRTDAMYPTDAAGSAEYGPVLMVQGRYQVVALNSAAAGLPDDPLGYAVLTSAGGLVRRELSLDDAKRWARELAEADMEMEYTSSVSSKAPRKRR